MLATGTKLGPYEIIGPLGAGGMGEVYRARDGRLDRTVAVKVIAAALQTNPERVRRFEAEARAAGALSHPNVVSVLDVGVHEGTPFFVSELVDGQTLRERMSEGALPLRKALDFAAQIASGLAAAHAKAIIHRDLKPENLILTRDGRVKILDFGLAKALSDGSLVDPQGATLGNTESGVVLGTAGYMAPEQVRGHGADARADIFALGAIFYEMLSGRRAFPGETPVEKAYAVLNEDPPDLGSSVPTAVMHVITRSLEKNPDERFHSAHDLALHLTSLAGASGLAEAPR